LKRRERFVVLSWLSPKSFNFDIMFSRRLRRPSGTYLAEWLIIFLVIFWLGRVAFLDFDDQQLQQTGEHNESATLPILAEIGLKRYGEIPLWNPYMLTGFPHAGDLINHFWNPIATVPVMIWGGINGMKVSIFLSFLAAGFGQWFLAHVFGLRGVFRLWAGLLFALSGGLALLSFLGWYELLVGVAWFPWCFALLWWALHRQDRLSLVLTAIAIALVLTTGGGYYPLYLGLSLTTLTGLALLWQKSGDRARLFKRSLAVAVLGAGLAAVYLLPLTDGWRYTARDAPPDLPQYNSQRVDYALFNYLVSDDTWFRADVLNKTSGSGWYYLGFLPILSLVFTPLLFARFSWRRRGLLTLFLLLLVLLLWHANRYFPVRYLYEWVPFLYTFRFSNRLLIVIASPLIVLAAMSLQGLVVMVRRHLRGSTLSVRADSGDNKGSGIRLVSLLNLAGVLLLVLTTVNVYQVNRKFAAAPHIRNVEAREVLTWLRGHDPDLYYTHIGGNQNYWDWMAYAYEYEMPVINFRYNRRVRSMDAQYSPESPFNAQARYVIAGQDQAAPEGTEFLTAIRGVNVWHRPDALPYAFTIASRNTTVTPESARETAVRLDGPNRVEVSGASGSPGEHLIVLVSDYPGWQLRVDGIRAEIQPVNGYLGATLLPGEHTYVFTFRPLIHYIGLGVSLVTSLLCIWLVLSERRKMRAVATMPEGGASPVAA